MSPFDAHDDYDSSLIHQGAWSAIYFAALCSGGIGPILKISRYVLLFQPEHIADEGEEPARVIAEKPILSLPARALNRCSVSNCL
jgi:hypothetical protein